jgi:nicotinate-nucleotide adenylyltransferase
MDVDLKIAIYGGSFNPIHNGHILTIAQLLLRGFDKVIVVPCYKHPFNKEFVNYDHRFNMCSMSLTIFNSEKVIVSDIESNLISPSYTSNTVKELYEFNKGSSLNTIFGADIKDTIDSFKGVEIIKELAPPIFVDRIMDISSTRIRDYLKHSRSMFYKHDLIPESVYKYISQHNLYI